MISILGGAGGFIWPLALCSLASVFIIIERAIGLRFKAIVPESLVESLCTGKVIIPKEFPTVRELMQFQQRHPKDSEGLRSLAQLQVNSLQRGLFLLETIVGIAPLIGLLGTVWGLIKVFSAIDAQSGLPDAAVFVEGIALALSTTLMGLCIAIVALVGNHYLRRKIEGIASRLQFVVERLVALG